MMPPPPEDSSSAEQSSSPLDWPCFLTDHQLRMIVSLVPEEMRSSAPAADLAEALDAVGIDDGDIGTALERIEDADAERWLRCHLPKSGDKTLSAKQVRSDPSLLFFAVTDGAVRLDDVRLEAMSRILLGRWEDREETVSDQTVEEPLDVLLVDEASERSDYLRMLLSKVNCRVSVSRTAGEAVAICTGSPFDAVFFDASLMGFGAIEAGRLIRRQSAIRNRVSPYLVSYGPSRANADLQTEQSVLDEQHKGEIDYEYLAEVASDVRRRKRLCSGDAELGRDRRWSPATFSLELDALSVLSLNEWVEDRDLLRRLISMLLKESVPLFEKLTRLRDAESVDGHKIERIVHSYKGGCDAVRAYRLSSVCDRMICFVRDGEPERALSMVPLLTREQQNFEAVVRALSLGDW